MVRALCPGAFLFLPVIFLLSLSFFILVVLGSVKTQALKTFGYIIVALIWLTTILVFAGGVYRTAKGMYPGMCMRKAAMKHPTTWKMQKGNSSEMIICPKMERK
ncbi:MAG: hypothetical protein PHT53_08230 [Candidatus Omnitrophica bacterium]|nr:hypothetical protein [Candidatus Omnitrophota bacterium]